MERKNIYIVIFIITTIIASCVALYFAINGSSEVSELNKTVNDVTLQLENSIVEEKVDNEKSFELVKVNLQNDMYLSKVLDNVKTKILNGKAYVAFTSDSIGSGKYEKKLNEYYEILGVNGKVVDISITRIPTSGYPIFVMLMEDGTLQKTKFVQGSDIVCDGVVNGYDNIIRIDGVEVENTNQIGDDVVKYYSTGIVVTDKAGNTELLKNLY